MAGKNAVVPHAKINLPADVLKNLAAEAQSISTRIGAPSGDRITCTLRKTFKMPDGTESAGPINAVIVDFVSFNAMYEGAYDPNDITPPICAAMGLIPSELAPYDDSPDKQCETCGPCPMNQFKSRGKGKACNNHRLLAILPTDADAETPLQVLRISPTALKAFDAHVSHVQRTTQLPPCVVVTEISFDEASEYPSLRFKLDAPCEKDLLAVVLSRRDEARKRLMQKPDFEARAAVAKPAAKGSTRRGKV